MEKEEWKKLLRNKRGKIAIKAVDALIDTANGTVKYAHLIINDSGKVYVDYKKELELSEQEMLIQTFESEYSYLGLLFETYDTSILNRILEETNLARKYANFRNEKNSEIKPFIWFYEELNEFEQYELLKGLFTEIIDYYLDIWENDIEKSAETKIMYM